MRRLVFLAFLLLLGGCALGSLASTAVDVVTLPVAVAAKGVDLATTSQSEADRNRGRELRRLEERCRAGRPLPQDVCPARQPR